MINILVLIPLIANTKLSMLVSVVFHFNLLGGFNYTSTPFKSMAYSIKSAITRLMNLLALIIKPSLLKYLVKGYCTIKQLDELARREQETKRSIIHFLSHPNIAKLVDNQNISFEMICNAWGRNANFDHLMHDNLAHMIQTRAVMPHAFLTYSTEQLDNLCIDLFSNGFEQFGLTLEDCLNLTPHQKNTLTNENLTWWLDKGLNIRHLLMLDDDSQFILEHSHDKTETILKALSMEPSSLLSMADTQKQRLKFFLTHDVDPSKLKFSFHMPETKWNLLQSYGDDHFVSLLNSGESKCDFFANEEIHTLITNTIVTFSDIENLTQHQRTNLTNKTLVAFPSGEQWRVPIFCKALSDRLVSLRDIDRHFSGNDVNNLVDLIYNQPNLRAAIQGGVTTFSELYPPGAAPRERQNTHSRSIHDSVSVSATNLQDIYQISNEVTIDKIVTDLKSAIRNGSSLTIKASTAMRALDRLPQIHYHDPKSGISLRQLLALCYTAISDKERATASFDDGLSMLIEGLYECQRGGNINNAEGIDRGQEDIPICPAGTVNKLMEKLCGIHPSVKVCFVTIETATLKLPRVVEEETVKYIAQLCLSVPEAAWKAILVKISEEGFDDKTYRKVEPAVKHRIKDEFGSLFQSEEELHTFVDNGKYADINSDQIIQKLPPLSSAADSGLFAEGQKDSTSRSSGGAPAPRRLGHLQDLGL
ncbi:hypothetical protein [Candidatus Synchoanobacter obligatus]|uniref:Uncharacterized protein n=1 Tax=Candidatus Synchoanobacter obligatus TaxID=2919597 RepID=A0ABT1L4K2_9GAMM|nr:hypothetical protein [Candidatus Synchoanobacter obligatus]MCP8352024.1 hypothetical protein [Candidatus Synchoanobacter obligatus]